MRRLGCLVVLICLIVVAPLGAQDTPRAVFGDPPFATLITVSAPNADGIVTISGSAGSAYPNAFLTLRNLYTYDTAFAVAGITGIFQTRIAASPNTPILISPSQQPPPTDPRDIAVAVPGGPATIVYVPFVSDGDGATAVTPISVDGELDDWDALRDAPSVRLDGLTVRALRNTESLYLGLTGLPDTFSSLVIDLLEGELRYSFRFERRTNGTFNPQAQFSGTLIRNPRTVTIAAAAGENDVELRAPLQIDAVNLAAADSVLLEGVRLLDASGASIAEYAGGVEFPPRNERDGLYRPDADYDGTPVTFTVGGALSGGTSTWSAIGRVPSLALDNDQQLRVELDVSFNGDIPLDAAISATLWLTPVGAASDPEADAALPVVDRFTNNGWSNVLTPSLLAVDNLETSIPVETIAVPSSAILRRENRASFPLTFRFTPPEDLPAGLYTARMQGYVTRGGETLPWEEGAFVINRPERENAPPQPYTRLPVVFSRGDTLSTLLPSALFMDSGLNGARGVISEDDRGRYALSDRIRYPSDRVVLPRLDRDGDPIAYSLEPYLLNALPNISTSIGAPLIPFDLPGGEISVRVRREGVSVANFRAPVAQVRLSTPAADDRVRFGSAAPVDVLQLTTLDPRLTAYEFPEDGNYTIEMTFTVSDVWGNRYAGGGVYPVRIAQPADIIPAVLPGTPFELGDTFDMGLHLYPGMPADVRVWLRVFPIDGGGVIQTEINGQANPRGIFAPDADTDGFTFEDAGEYVVDYEASWISADGEVWSAVLRSAGVIALGSDQIVAHGRRGMANVPDATPRPAWFFAQRYAEVIGTDMPPRPYFPYFSGDIVWMGSGEDDLLRPIMTVQDVGGGYSAWLEAVASARDLSLLDVRGELPIAVRSADTPFAALAPDEAANVYSYMSISRPGVNVRQTVLGGDDGGLSLAYSGDDRLNQQFGTGVNGAQPGDFAFLFGGAVIRTPELAEPAVPAVSDTGIYAALLIHEDEGDMARTLPPGRDPVLFTLGGETISAFFHPTGTRPGDVLTLGETFTLTGQAAPTLPMTIEAVISAPDGTTRTIRGLANAIGYFSDPSQNFVVDQIGVWRVTIRLRYDGVTSTGESTAALRGGVLGEQAGAFNVYVVPETHEALEWNPLLTDITIPAVVNYNFSFSVPADWTNTRAYRTLTTPAMILEDGDIRINGRSLTYTYNPVNLINRFSQLENAPRTPGESASDTRILTIVITGTDADGVAQIRSRTFTIWHDRLIALEV